MSRAPLFRSLFAKRMLSGLVVFGALGFAVSVFTFRYWDSIAIYTALCAVVGGVLYATGGAGKLDRLYSRFPWW